MIATASAVSVFFGVAGPPTLLATLMIDARMGAEIGGLRPTRHAARPAPRPPNAAPTVGWGRCPPRPVPGQALRRRISRFSRSFRVALDQSFCQWATGKAVKAKMSGAASASSSATWGKGFRSYSTTLGPVERGPLRETVAGRWCVPKWPPQPFGKLRRDHLGTRMSRLAMMWVRQRCQPAPANTAAMAFFSLW